MTTDAKPIASESFLRNCANERIDWWPYLAVSYDTLGGLQVEACAVGEKRAWAAAKVYGTLPWAVYRGGEFLEPGRRYSLVRQSKGADFPAEFTIPRE